MGVKFNKWKQEFKKQRKKLLISLFFLIIALILYNLAGDYVTDHKGSVVVPDLILDHFGPYNLTIIYVWFFLIVCILFFYYPFFHKIHDLHYVIKMFSLFVVIRAGFILLTHLRVPYDAIDVGFPSFFNVFNFSNDLFFSGHTGLPFLGFLLYKNNKKLSYFMLISSLILGVTVLLMHVHYSIDVLSAYFITYSIYKLGDKFIRK